MKYETILENQAKATGGKNQDREWGQEDELWNISLGKKVTFYIFCWTSIRKRELGGKCKWGGDTKDHLKWQQEADGHGLRAACCRSLYPLHAIAALQMPWPVPSSRQRPANTITVKSCKGKVGSTGSVSHPLERAGRIPEAEGGWSLHPLLPPPSSPAPLALFLSLCVHSFHGTGWGGEQEEVRRGGGRMPVPQRGGRVGCGVPGSCGSHAEPRCSHVHQRGAALAGRGGEYWISLWSGLNL